MPTLAKNKKAIHDYEFLDKFEGGLKLTGPEVKAAKDGQMQLKGAFLRIENGELWLKNAYIAKYKKAGPMPDYDPNRDRKVLVHKRELRKLAGKTQESGLTIVPISAYTKRGLVKLEFALARGKKKYEKRDKIKKRESDKKLRNIKHRFNQ